MKNMAVGSKPGRGPFGVGIVAGIWDEKAQLVLPEASAWEARQPFGSPAAGVPKAVRSIKPLASGPAVL